MIRKKNFRTKASFKKLQYTNVAITLALLIKTHAELGLPKFLVFLFCFNYHVYSFIVLFKTNKFNTPNVFEMTKRQVLLNNI